MMNYRRVTKKQMIDWVKKAVELGAKPTTDQYLRKDGKDICGCWYGLQAIGLHGKLPENAKEFYMLKDLASSIRADSRGPQAFAWDNKPDLVFWLNPKNWKIRRMKKND